MNHLAVKITSGPSSEPVTVAEAKLHARVSLNDDDALIADYITAAREFCENYTGRAAMSTTYRMVLDQFPLIPNSQFAPGNPNALTPQVNNTWPLSPNLWAILLPRAPLVSVTSIQYYDAAGVLQTMDPALYIVDSDSEPPRLAPITGGYWPPTSLRPGAIQVTFQAGYATASAVPMSMKLAIRQIVSHMYENREAVSSLSMNSVPLSAMSLLDSIRVHYFW